jgi:hypothetical protein
MLLTREEDNTLLITLFLIVIFYYFYQRLVALNVQVTDSKVMIITGLIFMVFGFPILLFSMRELYRKSWTDAFMVIVCIAFIMIICNCINTGINANNKYLVIGGMVLMLLLVHYIYKQAVHHKMFNLFTFIFSAFIELFTIVVIIKYHDPYISLLGLSLLLFIIFFIYRNLKKFGWHLHLNLVFEIILFAMICYTMAEFNFLYVRIIAGILLIINVLSSGYFGWEIYNAWVNL